MNHWFLPLALILLVRLVALMSRIPGGQAANVLVSTQPDFVVYPKQYLSVNDQYYMVMRPDCNVVLYEFSQPLVITTLNTHNVTVPGSAPNCSLWMQADGNLVIYNFTSGNLSTLDPSMSIWEDGHSNLTDGPGSFLLVGGDGTFDFYLYSTNSTLRPGPYNSLYNSYSGFSTSVSTLGNLDLNSYTAWKPNNSLVDFPYMPAEYFLTAGNRLLTTTKTKRYALELGTDCNLQSKQLLDDGNQSTLWESQTGKNRTCQLTLQQNGVLQILDMNSGDVYWNSTSNGSSDPVSWNLRVDPDTGSLSISDITNDQRVLWTNIVEPPTPPIAVAPAVKTGRRSVAVVVGVVVGGGFALALAALGLYFYAREKFLNPSEKAFQVQLRAKGGTSYAWSLAKIKQATENYKNLIGRGGFGDVFYGKLPNGQEVAAKVLSANSHQSKHEFFNEIELLSMVHHKNLVTLLGYSCKRTQQVLIYEFIGGGDLRHRLQAGESSAENPLSWLQRTSIILQVAEGLEYLHEKCCPPIIHRDVKSTNILLTDKLVAKVADFGLSKLKTIGQEDATHVTTEIKGTPGYLDPEYHETGELTEKSDVYAFGVMLMEILTGQHHMNIAQRVGEAWRQEQFDGLADPSLGEDFNRDELVNLVELALWCVRKSRAHRPFMRQVVRRLHDLGLASSEPSQPGEVLAEEERLRASYIELITTGSEVDCTSEIEPLPSSQRSL